MTCDPNWGNVLLLLPFDGTAGQTTFPDLSPYAHVMAVSGGVQVETSNVMFGTGAVTFPSIGFLVSPDITAAPELDISTGDFTIEMWVYPTAASNDIFAVGTYSSTGGISVGLGGGPTLAPLVWTGSGFTALPTPNPTPLNAWSHIALVRDGSTFTFYTNGVGNIPITYAGSLQLQSNAAVLIGLATQSSGFVFSGNIDEFRLSNFARYTSNFTPTGPFPTVSCTVTVPDVVGQTDTVAQAAIIAATLTVGSITTISGGVPNTVQSQSPVAGSIVAGATPVDLIEYEGDNVPDVVNTSLAVIAPAILIAAGFVVGTVTYAPSGVIIAGNVISQSPVAGTAAAAGSGVDLVVSTGLPPLTVPDIYGLSQADAELAITSLGLVVGAVSSAPSKFVPPNLVQTQNPTAGTVVAVGTIVSFVLSLGNPAVGTKFDFEATVISQYANSPTLLQLVSNMNDYIDQSTNFANFYNFVWNVDTAVGFGLDIWGKIVGVSRLLHIPTTVDYVGFDNSATPPPDWQTMGSDQDTPPVGGAMYTGYNATQTFLLPDDAYRQLILAKAFANICATTAPAINTILQNLYGPGTAYVLNEGPMAISYNLTFTPSAIQLAILEQSGVIPTPPGVSVTVNAP